MLPKIKDKRYNTRSTDEYENFPRPNEKYYKSFFPHFTRSWNNLDKEIREDRDHHNFKEQIKTRSSWLNCALRDDEPVYWVSIGHYEAVAVGN